jgi:alpha-1,3-rhamnosyltransferase
MSQERLPLVTAVVPVFNHENYVAASIQSIIDQTYQNVELLVINDGSTDESSQRVLELGDECRQRFVRFQFVDRENRGLTATLNESLDWARGKYFSPLASDDVVLPRKFELLVSDLEARPGEVAAAFGDATFIDEQGREICLNDKGIEAEDGAFCSALAFHLRSRKLDLSSEFGTYRSLLRSNYMPAMSSMLKTEALRKVGGWTVGNVLEDWEMWLKLSKHYRMIYLNESVALYRIHGKNSYDSMRQSMLNAAMVLLEQEKAYCDANGMLKPWSDASNGLFYWILRYGEGSFADRCRRVLSLGPKNALSLFSFLIKEKAGIGRS